MSERKYKGSVWNRWDLHVHTPESVLHNEFGPNWDNYAYNLFRKAIDNEVKAIGITDYYFIDGYKKLKLEYLNEAKLQALGFNPEEISKILELLIFPNVEFRINKLVVSGQNDPRWNRKVNLHLILSDQISIGEIEELLQTLSVQTLASQGRTQTRRLTKNALEEIGNTIISQQSEFKDHTPLKAGMLCISVDYDELLRILSERRDTFYGRHLIAIAADEDLSAVQWGSQGHLDRKNLIRSSHIILSSNPNTARFLLGEFHSSLSAYESEFEKCKPCLWGSDAHGLERLFKPNLDRNTWIKSKICFEGIMQTVHEPKYRARIQPTIPGHKTPYLVIDKVRFLDESGLFSKEWIYLNDDLNVIIGGKSSGKSLLLYFIAKTLDKNQVISKNDPKIQDYKEIEKRIDFEVVLNDGTHLKLSESRQVCPISYLPQMYINSLAENNGKQDFYRLINDILLQDKSVFDAHEDILRGRDEIKAGISEKLVQLFMKLNSRISVNKQIKAKGAKSQILHEIERLQGQKLEITKRSELSSDELEVLKELQFKRVEQLELSRKFQRNIHIIEEYIALLEKCLTDSNIALKSSNLNLIFKQETREKLQSINIDLMDNIRKTYEESISHIQQVHALEMANFRFSEVFIVELDGKLAPLIEKISSQSELQEIDKLITEEQEKIQIFESLESTLSKLDSEIENMRCELHQLYLSLYTQYTLIVDLFKSNPLYNEDNELKIKSVVDFKTDEFCSAFVNLFDLRRNLSSLFGEHLFDGNLYKHQPNKHFDNFKQMFDVLFEIFCKEEQIPLKTGYSIENVINKLFEDNFFVDHTINYKGDDISIMSPGKKGVVLMQLLLNISNSKFPILIDQPEDNLDNRTIFSELNEFIKKKKIDRQIIIVTHNANLVVSTDADNVIVANQDGQVSSKENKAYQFEYCNGPLESTFSDSSKEGILYKFGIREHVCEILEGGELAFKIRERKYGFN